MGGAITGDEEGTEVEKEGDRHPPDVISPPTFQPRLRLCRTTVEQLVEEADDKLFTNVMYNKQHILHSTLPGTMDTKYHLRPRPHNFKLTAKNSLITECDFITRMLFKDVYCCLLYTSPSPRD